MFEIYNLLITYIAFQVELQILHVILSILKMYGKTYTKMIVIVFIYHVAFNIKWTI